MVDTSSGWARHSVQQITIYFARSRMDPPVVPGSGSDGGQQPSPEPDAAARLLLGAFSGD